MRSWIVPGAAAGLLLQACAPQTPEQARIDNIEDAASAEVDAIESASDNQLARIRAEADTLTQQAETAKGFDAERLKTRAEALRKDASIVERHAEAQARAIRDRARADVSALKAQ
jgi:ABC-type microcin C transport system permease subunit YejB